VACAGCCTEQSNGLVANSACDIDSLTALCAGASVTSTLFCKSQCHTMAVSMQSDCSTSAG
jgi:hypothetical protein